VIEGKKIDNKTKKRGAREKGKKSPGGDDAVLPGAEGKNEKFFRALSNQEEAGTIRGGVAIYPR